MSYTSEHFEDALRYQEEAWDLLHNEGPWKIFRGFENLAMPDDRDIDRWIALEHLAAVRAHALIAQAELMLRMGKSDEFVDFELRREWARQDEWRAAQKAKAAEAANAL